MAKKSNVVKLNKYRRSMNIGIIIFAFILIYVVILIIQYFSKSHLEFYDIQEASLAQDNVVTGMILRDETVIEAKYSGYVNYYFPDNSRITKDAVLFSIDETKDVYNSLMNHDVKKGLTSDDSEYIKRIIQEYRDTRQASDYQYITSFVDELHNAVQEVTDDYSVETVNTLVGENPPASFHMYYSDKSGLISYNTDELCGITLEQIRENSFSLATGYKEYKKRKTIVAEGSPVVKYITSDSWQILCKLNDSQKKSIQELKEIDFIICDDGFKTSAPVSVIEIDSKPYAVITMNDYVQNYLNQRFLSIELNWQVSSGYKIPLSAITEKEFYVIPIQYFTRGGNINQLGLVREVIDSKTGLANYDFVECMIYHNDGMYYYVSTTDFQSGENVFSESGEVYQLGLKESLEGVYNINKGYALFRRIERITQNDEYCIVHKGTEYGINLYDHIALKALDAVDSGIIY